MIPLCKEDLYVYIKYINWSQGVNLIQPEYLTTNHGAHQVIAAKQQWPAHPPSPGLSQTPRTPLDLGETGWETQPRLAVFKSANWIPMDSYLDTKKIKVPNSANMFEQMPNRGLNALFLAPLFHFFWWTNSVDPPGVTTSSPKRAETQTPIQARGKRCLRQGKPVASHHLGTGHNHGQVIENTT